jgi:hypothetical protein
MLSLKSGYPLGYIDNATKNVIYLKDTNQESAAAGSDYDPGLQPIDIKTSYMSILDSPVGKKKFKKLIENGKIRDLKEAIKDLDDPDELEEKFDNKILAGLDDLKSLAEEVYRTEFYCKDLFQPLLDLGKHQSFVAMGASGAGKSYYMGKLLDQLRNGSPIMKKDKEKDIYIISLVNEDEAYDKYKPCRIPTTGEEGEEWLEHPPEIDELADSVVIFDDITAIKEKRVKEAVKNLCDLILETGRHHSITTMCTNHLVRGGNETKKMLNEATSLTFFPQANWAPVGAFLKDVAGFSKSQLDKARELSADSRWLTFMRTFPNVLLHQHGCWIVS